MMGFGKSASFMPVARHRARAPAMLRPGGGLERYAGMVIGKGMSRGNATARNCGPVYTMARAS